MLNSRHNVTKNGKKNKLFISFKHGFLNTQVLAILKIENISLSSSRWSAFVFILISRDTIGECLQQPSCGAKYPGTLQTSHPDGLAPGEHCQRNVCFAKKDTCCFKITTIKIMRCQGFWIYELPPASVNKARYCGNKGKKRVDGYFEHCKNWTCHACINLRFLKSGRKKILLTVFWVSYWRFGLSWFLTANKPPSVFARLARRQHYGAVWEY